MYLVGEKLRNVKNIEEVFTRSVKQIDQEHLRQRSLHQAIFIAEHHLLKKITQIRPYKAKLASLVMFMWQETNRWCYLPEILLNVM